MFCPKCKAEYAEGVWECPECDVALVEELPPEATYLEFREVLSTFNQGDIAVLKALLDSEGIVYYFRDEAFNLLRPMAQPAILMVCKGQVHHARKIIKDLNLRYYTFALDEEENEHEPS